MRHILSVTICVLITLGCQTVQNQQDELPAVERVVYDFNESIATFNYQSIRDHCTTDFKIFEDGQVMNMDEFIDFVKNFEGKTTLAFTMEDLKTNIDGKFAWMTLRNKVVMTTGEQSTNAKLLQSAVLKKDEGFWKLVFYHSTAVRDSDF